MNFRYQSKNFESMSVYVYNHWVTKSTLTYCPFTTCILCIFEENLGNACSFALQIVQL